MLVLGLLLLMRLLCLLSLHMRVLGVHLMMHLSLDGERRTVRPIENASLMIDGGRLEFTARVDDRGRRMAVRRGCVTHVSHPRGR